MPQTAHAPHQVPAPDIALAERLFATLAQRTKDVLGVTRAAYGEGEQFAHDLVAAEAARSGLERSVDAAGNLYLRLPGDGASRRAIIVGSHLDSVPMGGNFDGAAGVMAGLAVLAGWARADYRLSDDVVLMAIRAEESNWFPYSYIGSRAALGRLPPEALDLRRSDTGRTLADHMSQLGFDPEQVRAGVPQVEPASTRAFIELHIEQGPILIERSAPVAVVTGIRGSFRHREARVVGEYAHSGAVPRTYRHDAVVATADLVMRLHAEWLRLEAEGRDLTFTVGQLATNPEQHAFSKIAGEVNLSIDVRSHHTPTLDLMRELCLGHIDEVAARHGVTIEPGPLTGSRPAFMDQELIGVFSAAMEEVGLPRFEMPSGAGHDAATFADAGVPTAMLFVRNQNGSHNPYEAMEMADFAMATRVLAHGLAHFR